MRTLYIAPFIQNYTLLPFKKLSIYIYAICEVSSKWSIFPEAPTYICEIVIFIILDFYESTDEITNAKCCECGKHQDNTFITCGKQFVNQLQLNKHSTTHTGAKPFSCNICAKCFRLKEQLTRHTKTHAVEEQFSCEI